VRSEFLLGVKLCPLEKGQRNKQTMERVTNKRSNGLEEQVEKAKQETSKKNQ